MKNNAKSYREIIALIGIALIVTDIARTSQARDFADKSNFAKIDVPSSAGYTAPNGINAQGDIVGTYGAILNNNSVTRGFLLSKGTFTNIDVNLPGAIPGSTNATGINAQGDIVGFYASDNGNVGFGFDEKGFLLRKGGFTAIEAPGSTFTVAYGINSQGDIVGWYFDSGGNEHGFLLSKGTFTNIDVPGALAGSSSAVGINSQGDIVGAYSDSGGNGHGFLRSKGGFIKIDVPATFGIGTQAYGINPQGDIVGLYFDGSGLTHGFLLRE